MLSTSLANDGRIQTVCEGQPERRQGYLPRRKRRNYFSTELCVDVLAKHVELVTVCGYAHCCNDVANSWVYGSIPKTFETSATA